MVSSFVWGEKLFRLDLISHAVWIEKCLPSPVKKKKEETEERENNGVVNTKSGHRSSFVKWRVYKMVDVGIIIHSSRRLVRRKKEILASIQTGDGNQKFRRWRENDR